MERLQVSIMTPDGIKNLAKQGEFDTALSHCQQMLDAGELSTPETHRLRAFVYSIKGDYNSALVERDHVIESADCELRDLYLAADNALNSNHFSTCVDYLDQLLHRSKVENEKWFDSAAHFYRSYAFMHLGEFDAALESLGLASESEPDISMPIPGNATWDCARLRKEIISKRGES